MKNRFAKLGDKKKVFVLANGLWRKMQKLLTPQQLILFNQQMAENHFDKPSIKPSKDAEKNLGITGLSHTYNMPDGYAAVEIESLTRIYSSWLIFTADNPIRNQGIYEKFMSLESEFNKFAIFIKQIYSTLIMLNPELADIKVNDKYIFTYINLINGACSEYLSTDIKFFVENMGFSDFNLIQGQKDKCNEQIKKAVGKKFTKEMQIDWWRPCDKTIDYIYEQLSQKYI